MLYNENLPNQQLVNQRLVNQHLTRAHFYSCNLKQFVFIFSCFPSG